jgi:hypothetical protein|tara:strand:+ start:274 stop:1296 length:1023 start_codon:yes stop_codon:yes gene_type:complete
MSDKILILKNDRGGDLFTSLLTISSLKNKYENITIYLSELNIGFDFLFKDFKIKKVSYNLSIYDKFKILKDIIINKYKEIYILSPKSYYFYLPFFFRNIKFYAIVYNGRKRLRPNKSLRKFLYKYQIVYRNKLNEFSYRELQTKLLEKDINFDYNFKNLTIPEVNNNFINVIPSDYIFFQFRYKFFDEINWSNQNIKDFIIFLSNKYKYVLFCSDIESNKRSDYYSKFFIKNYSTIDLNNNSKSVLNNKNIFYLKNLNSLDLFFIIKNSSISLAKDGVVSHIAYFHNKKCHNLFNFKISNLQDYKHQKISYSEWYKGMNLKFSILNENVNKAIKKINRHI